MKKYLKQFWIVLLAAAALLLAAAALRSASAGSDIQRTLRKTWDVELPGGYTVEYRAATARNLDKGGLRFHALLYDDWAVLDDLLPWIPCTRPTQNAGSGAEVAREILTALNVPGGEWPDLEKAGMWYAAIDGAEVLLFHEQEDLRLYILESVQ